MNIFYLRPDAVAGSTGEFDSGESHHIINVLRLAAGDTIEAVDGAGNKYQGRLTVAGKRKAGIEIIKIESITPPVPHITVCVGLLKNRQRLEWMIEKLTEIGVRRIVLLHTDRTERTKFRIDRFEGVALSAMKQSLRADLPEIDSVSFRELHKTVQADTTDYFLAHEVQSEKPDTQSLISRANQSDKKKCLLIGPEGGFSDEEIIYAQQTLEARMLWLGRVRLRTETAAIHLAGLFRFL